MPPPSKVTPPISVAWRAISGSSRAWKQVFGAEGGTRTPTGFLPPPPQDGVSANSTTSALGAARRRSLPRRRSATWRRGRRLGRLILGLSLRLLAGRLLLLC